MHNGSLSKNYIPVQIIMFGCFNPLVLTFYKSVIHDHKKLLNCPNCETMIQYQ